MAEPYDVPAEEFRPGLLSDQMLDEWERYAMKDEAEGKHFLAPPGALLGLIHEVKTKRGRERERSNENGPSPQCGEPPLLGNEEQPS